MNPISAFFVRNIIIVYFFYGLAFFALGLALFLASRRPSEFRFARAIRPLAAFGLLHGLHEWVEMFQKIAALSGGYTPGMVEEVGRMLVLVLSFLMLLLFGMLLLHPNEPSSRALAWPVLVLTLLWLGGVIVSAVALRPPMQEIVAQADVLARYGLGIPAALLGTWALMRQQRTFREHGMPQFGQDLVWAATALFIYGVLGQLFVRRTALVPSNLINSTLFLQWFGIPIQLFRGAMASALAYFMVRALNAFELENQRSLERANQARVQAQEAQIEAERRNRREVERLNEELRFTAHELALLLDVANLLVAPLSLRERLHTVLEKLVQTIPYCAQGMILLVEERQRRVEVASDLGFNGKGWEQAVALGKESVAQISAMCLHADGATLRFQPTLEGRRECQQYASPILFLGLPLRVQQEVIGSLVLGRDPAGPPDFLSLEGYQLVVAAAQQLGLSIENARLYEEAQGREELLARLLHQVVEAQEAERKRIARELHDATGQSLTAISLGLRGVEALLDREQSTSARQVQELGAFSAHALGELRQIIADLRPSHLDDLGLVPALRWYLKNFSSRRGIATQLEVAGGDGRLPSEYETVLFRITQEAMTNIAKHAQASEATVTVERKPDEVWLTVADNGRGFDLDLLRQDTATSGWGLLGMQERAALLGGSVEVESAPGQGTKVWVRVPYIMEREHGEANQTIAG